MLNPAVLTWAHPTVTDGGGGLVITDSFDRADASTLGATDTGQEWSTPSGGTWTVLEGAAKKTSAAGYTPAIVFMPTIEMKVTAEVSFYGSKAYPGLVGRVVNGNTMYALWWVGAGWELSRRVGGSQQLLANIPRPSRQPISATFTEEAGGTRVLIEESGVVVDTLLDTSGSRPMGVGAGIFVYAGNSDARIDNFKAEAI